MKKIFTLFLLVFSVFSVYAQTVSSVVALKAAESFSNRTFMAATNVRMAYSISSQSDTSLFVFNIGNEGFVIIAGDYSVSPILAWSDEGNYKPNNQAPATVEWLQGYSNQILSVRNSKNALIKNKEWGELLSDYTPELPDKSAKIVAPLVTTKWDQGKFYNYMCPVYATGPDGRCVTGCVATAMAQIMKFYNYPNQGMGTHYYTHPHFGNIGVDFGATTYNWSNMGTYANLTNQESVGTLIYHCGVSVDMDYGPQESGAYTETAVMAFKNYFHYRNTIKMIEKNDYSEFDWIVMLKDNLEENHPILYSGSGAGGHAWVCSGYDASNRFHMNWGWSGSNNGYFLVSNLNPSGYTFNYDQKAIINIAPYFAPYCLASRTFTDSTKVISDGSGYSYYWNDTDCDWLIKPTGAEKVVLEFTEFKTETGNDFLSVYDGETTSDPLLGTFSGYDFPPVLTANSGKMLITFNSNSTTQELGWIAKYWCLKAGSGIDENENERLLLYPNPTTDQLNLIPQGTMDDNAVVTIFDYSGKEVYATDLAMTNDKTLKIDVSRLVAGFYILSLQSERNNYRVKFIKQ